MYAGLMSMKDRLMILQANYIWTPVCKRKNSMIHMVFKIQLEQPMDPYTKAWMAIQKEVGILADFLKHQALNKALSNVSMNHVLQVKEELTTMRVVPQLDKWFFAIQEYEYV